MSWSQLLRVVALGIACAVGLAAATSPAEQGRVARSFRVGEAPQVRIADIAIDESGFLYVVHTEDRDPASAFVRKLTPEGETLFVFPLGTLDGGWITAMAVDQDGSVVVAGYIGEGSLLITGDSVQPRYGGGYGDGYVAKIDRTGTQLVFATYLGGSGQEFLLDVAVGADGRIVVVGETDSGDFPVTAGLPQTGGDDRDCVVTILSADGSNLVSSRRLGGTGKDWCSSVTVGSAGDQLVSGVTASEDFPATPGALRTEALGPEAGFVVKVAANGSDLLYSALLGDAHPDAITIDGFGRPWLAGSINPEGHPAPPTYREIEKEDAFIARLSEGGTQLDHFSTYGGFRWDTFSDIAVDRDGNVVAFGGSTSPNFPVTPNAQQPCAGLPAYGSDLVYVKLSNSGRLLHASYLGGVGSEERGGLAIAADDSFYVAGSTDSGDFPWEPRDIPIDYFMAGHITRIEMAESVPRVGCLVNAATQEKGYLSPGQIVTLYGSGLGPAEGVGALLDEAGRVSSQLSGSRVLIGGLAAPLLYLQERQINTIVPFGVSPGAAGFPYTTYGRVVVDIEVETAAGALSPFRAEVRGITLGIFTVDHSGDGPGAILNEDGSVNSADNPAEPGSVVMIFGAGGGRMEPQPQDGEIVGAPAEFLGADQFSVFFDGDVRGQVFYAGAAPGLVAGALQVNVRIPEKGLLPGPDHYVTFSPSRTVRIFIADASK